LSQGEGKEGINLLATIIKHRHAKKKCQHITGKQQAQQDLIGLYVLLLNFLNLYFRPQLRCPEKK
jgi:hypothetical protein